MAQAKKLVNKMKRRERYIREGTESAPKMDKSKAVMQDSPGAQRVMRGAQRRMDASWGSDAVGQEPQLEYALIAQDLERFDFGGSDFGMLMTLTPDQLQDAEVTDITAVADTGEYESFTLTAPAGAGATQADYFTMEAPNGDVVAFWLDIDAAGTAPTGAAYTAADVQVEVDILSLDTNIQVAGKIATAMAAVADVTVTDNADGTLTVDYDLMGAHADADTFNADDSGAGSIGATTDTQGADSNLNSAYFTLDTPSTDYYVWYNVGGEGVDPGPIVGRTAVPVAIAAGDSASDVATATAAELDPLATMDATSLGAVITVTNAADGPAPDAADGAAPTGFSFDVQTQGQSTEGSAGDLAGLSPGDVVQILEGEADGRMLEVIERVSGYQFRLDDIATYTGPESDVACRLMLSTVKKSYV